MATIACLGWGSLICDWGMLPLVEKGEKESPWCSDGPLISVEFARQSQDGRMTLVIVKNSRAVTTLWARVGVATLACAAEALREREGTNIKHIGTWSAGDNSPADIPDLANWAAVRKLDHVIWTALPAKFDGRERVPGEQEVVNYLSQLSGRERASAERYIRKAPKQIDTPYRSAIEAALGWTPIDC